MSDRPVRLPLLVSPSNRGQTTERDAKLLNGYVEQLSEDEYWVYKRPGMQVVSSRTPAAGRGIYFWDGDLYEIWGNKLYKNGAAISGTVQASGVYTFSSTLGSVHKLFFHNTVKGYTYDTSGGLVEVPAAVFIEGVVGNFTSGSAVVTSISPNTTGMVSGMFVVGPNVPDGAAILTVDSSTQITLTEPASGNGTGTSFTASNDGLPANLVPGSAYLDGTTYIMNRGAAILGSEVNDPSKYDPLNKIIAQIEPEDAVALAKQLVYVVAFKQSSVEVFYDAGNTVGSPLGQVQGAKVNVGCRSANSLQDLEGTLLWVSQSRNGSVAVYALDGLKARHISTPSVEKLLESADFATVYSWSVRVCGHKFYGLTVVDRNLTMVYDLTSARWYEWTDTDDNYLPIISSTYDGEQKPLLQHATNGKVYSFEDVYYLDDGQLFTFSLVTPNYDGGIRFRKMLPSMDFIADQTNGSILTERHSDNDYQNWTTPKLVDLGQARPRLVNLGTFRRRAFYFSHRCNTPLRIKAVEMQIDVGTL